MIKLFFSYSHKDEALRDQLADHLAAMKRQGVIDGWHDRRMLAGDHVDDAIRAAMEEADIVLLLVSPAFIASDYCYDVEMTQAVQRHTEGRCRTIPVILRPCDWHRTPFGKLLAVPRDGKAATSWPNLDEAFLDAAKSIRAAAEVMRHRKGEGVAAGTVARIAAVADWARATNTGFSIAGVSKPLSIEEAWLPIKAWVRKDAADRHGSLAEAFETYRNWTDRDRGKDERAIDPETLGWFYRQCVVVGGPGLGKSTLLTRLALEYARDGFPVLKIRLRTLATRMRGQGCSLEEGLFTLGLDGSGLSLTVPERNAIADWVILCDGLDECGAMQEAVAQGLRDFAAGHPQCRVIVTTRPIGYATPTLAGWRHYDLGALQPHETGSHLADLLADIDGARFSERWKTAQLLQSQLDRNRLKDVLARSPLLMGLAASLIAGSQSLGDTRVQLYQGIFRLFDGNPTGRDPEVALKPAVLKAFLDRLGWELTIHPLRDMDSLLAPCADALAAELGCPLLAARDKAERCLEYWEAIGVVERLHFAGGETLAFVHKSFEEFTAARHLCSLPVSERVRVIERHIGDAGWREVMCFAASMGLAEPVCAAAFALVPPAGTDDSALVRTLDLMADCEAPIQGDLPKEVFHAALRFAAAERRSMADNVGLPLARLSAMYPAIATDLFTPLRNAPKDWTRLIAWACVLNTGAAAVAPQEVFDFLAELPALVGPAMRGSLGGGLVLRHISSEGQIAKIAAVRGLRTLLKGSTFGKSEVESLARKINELSVPLPSDEMREAGLAGALINEEDHKSPSDFLPSPQYNAARRTKWTLLLSLLSKCNDNAGASKLKRQGFALSAFNHGTQLSSIVSSDTWSWTKPFDETVFSEVVRGAVGATGLDTEALASDAASALERVCNTESGAHVYLDEAYRSLDFPEADWSAAKHLDLDAEKLESLFDYEAWSISRL